MFDSPPLDGAGVCRLDEGYQTVFSLTTAASELALANASWFAARAHAWTAYGGTHVDGTSPCMRHTAWVAY
jgi:hypothetical protein